MYDSQKVSQMSDALEDTACNLPSNIYFNVLHYRFTVSLFFHLIECSLLHFRFIYTLMFIYFVETLEGRF